MSPKHSQQTYDQKMQILLDTEGYDDIEDFMQETMHESIVPAICMNKDCDYVSYYEPDQTEGWCEECHTQSCMSGHEILFAGGMV